LSRLFVFSVGFVCLVCLNIYPSDGMESITTTGNEASPGIESSLQSLSQSSEDIPA